ncbi:MAG: phage terminase small subunit [Erythrobacter sp.]|nr:phage terminase small subunit [Erythrobacter sp.]
MKSPFRQHQQRVRAHMAGKAAQASRLNEPSPDTEAGQEYVFMKVRLAEGLRILQDIESHEARKPVKAQLAKDFADWIDGVLAADEPVQDEVLMTNMVWAIDTGDFERAVQIGAFALKHGLAMPDRYNRTAACFLREDIAQIALDAPETVDHGLLLEIDQLTADADMPDAAKAKLSKALGRSWAAKAAAFDPSADSAPAGGAASYWQQALDQLRRALALDRKVGVKKDIETAERRLRELSGEDEPSDNKAEQPTKPAQVAKPAAKKREGSGRKK